MESIALLSLPAAADDTGSGTSYNPQSQSEEDIIERNLQDLPPAVFGVISWNLQILENPFIKERRTMRY